MGGGPRNPKDAPADCLATDSVIHHTSEVSVVTEDDAATITGREQDSSNAVAEEVQTVKANNQDPPLDSQEQRIAKLNGIYAGLVMVESECIEVDGKHLLATGIELVEQISRDLKSAKEKAKKEAAEAKAEQEAAEAKVEQETAQAEEDNKHSNPDPEAMPTSVGERLDETASREAEAEEAFEEITPEEAELEEVDHEKTSPKVADANADAALDEVTVTTHPVDQDANLSAQEPQASPEEAGTAPADSGKDTADTGVDTTALTKETKSESEKKPKTELPCYVEFRQLGDQSLYKKIGSEYWVLIDSQWVPSLNAEQFAALIELHRTLLHKHYDFLLESQHPSASAALKRLAAKHAMPGRIWWHGIHSFLEVMRKRLVESGEHMACFIILAYKMMSLLEETVPHFRHTWIECKADLARYGMATQSGDKKALQRWHDISKEEYTRVSGENPTTGLIYHHLAILARPQTRVSSDEEFEATVSQFFYYTKSLVVEVPFFAAREVVLTLIKPIVDRNEKEAEKPASVPQTDKDHFLTAVSHLILASLEPETLRKNGYNDSRKEHVQAVYAALEKIRIDASSNTSRMCPSPQLGLLLCQLLLGIPLIDQRWSPMMAAWAEDRDNSDAMANARDIHDVTIELISTMVPYLLEEADTRDLRLWGFIYVMLVFMRSLKTRPRLLKRFGSAFHAQLLARFLNMLLREDEARGALALESASQSELDTICSLLNEDKRLDKYGLSTEDSLRKYLREQEEQRKAELVKSEAEAKDATATPEGSQTTAEEDKVPREESTAATEETTTSDAAHEKDLDTKTPDWELVYANTLPEHSLLAGFFFAREAEPEPRDKSLEKPAEDAVVVACPAAPDATPAAVQTAKEPAAQTVDESVEASLVEVRREENENEDVQQQDSQAKEVEAEKTQEEDEQKDREAEEAEVRRREGLHRVPPLFPNGWFKRSKYDYDEMQVRNYVQDAATCDARSNQLLRLAAQLSDCFFVFETDEERRYWISVPGASSVPKPDPNKKMPEIIERDGGVRVVYVHPFFHAAEIEREKRRAAREEKKRKEEERQKEKQRKEDEAKATTDVATIAVNEKVEGDAEEQPTQSEKPVSQVDAEKATEAVNLPAVAPSTVSEDGDHEPSSAYEMDLDKAIGLENATAAAQKPPVTHEAEPTEAEPTKAKVEMTLPVRGVDDAHTKGSGAGSDAAAATTTAPAADAATDPQVTVPLSEGVLDSIPKTEDSTKAIKRWRAASKGLGADEGTDEDEDKDEKEWERLSNESHGDAKVETTSMFSRFFFG